ncbi:histidine phosphatase superfamily [Endogone sp. FLAS-F59071]|nr:histidine phosphatase superfamily [Endogone sp. FLAS-F59071]|eukprot:RUS17145.1 histidine phosphatase superfamily [Endogone sp. FLAS-F59071]
MPVLDIFIVRHGQTDANVFPLIFQGHGQNPLNVTGQLQARLVGRRLGKEALDIIYSSDLLRAKMVPTLSCPQTTEAITEHHPGISTVFDARLREKHAGSLEGHTTKGLNKALAGISPVQHEEYTQALDTYITSHGGETMRQLGDRIVAAYNDIVGAEFARVVASNTGTRTVLIVSHGGPIRELVDFLVNVEGYDLMEGEAAVRERRMQHNTGVTRVVVTADEKGKVVKGKLVMVNNVGHLAGMTRAKQEKAGEVDGLIVAEEPI